MLLTRSDLPAISLLLKFFFGRKRPPETIWQPTGAVNTNRGLKPKKYGLSRALGRGGRRGPRRSACARRRAPGDLRRREARAGPRAAPARAPDGRQGSAPPPLRSPPAPGGRWSAP